MHAHTHSGIHCTTDRHSIYTRPSIYGLLAQVSNQRWHCLSKRAHLLAPQSIWMPTAIQYVTFHTQLHSTDNYRHCLASSLNWISYILKAIFNSLHAFDCPHSSHPHTVITRQLETTESHPTSTITIPSTTVDTLQPTSSQSSLHTHSTYISSQHTHSTYTSSQHIHSTCTSSQHTHSTCTSSQHTHSTCTSSLHTHSTYTTSISAHTISTDVHNVRPSIAITAPTPRTVVVKDYQILVIAIPTAVCTVLIVLCIVAVGVCICCYNRGNRGWK